MFSNAENLPADRKDKLKLQVVYLKNLIQYCEKGEEFGLNYAYYIMTSAINLCTLYIRHKELAADGEVTTTLNVAIERAREVLSQKDMANELYDDPEGVMRDARNILEQYGATSVLLNQVFGEELKNRSDLKKPENVVSIDSVDDLSKLIDQYGKEEAGRIAEELAISGNLACQILLSQMGLCLLQRKQEDAILKRAEKFTKLAAEGGDADSQMNLALLYFKRVDASKGYLSEQEIELIKLSAYWHEKAARQGIHKSQKMLSELKSTFANILG